MRPSRPAPESALALFCERWEADDEQEAIEFSTARITEGAEIRLPVDPTAIAEKFGARVVTVPQTDQESLQTGRHGQLSVVDHRWEIRVPVETINERRRFSIAHEIGHILLFDAVAEQPQLVRDLRKVQFHSHVEIVCNQIAARILMPTTAFAAAVERIGGLGAPDLLAKLADLFWVSQGAAARRIVELDPARRLLIWDWIVDHANGPAWRTAKEQDRSRDPFIPYGLSSRRLHPNVVGAAAGNGSSSASFVKFDSPTIAELRDVHAYRRRERQLDQLAVEGLAGSRAPAVPRVYLVGSFGSKS